MKLEIAVFSLLFTLNLCPSLQAQISSDGSLSTTVSTDDGVNFIIEGEEQSLNNLFHSFSEFSIPNLGSAYFNNATDITNIFSRVTGGNISEIQGLIRANGTANLFLINPAGIVFGENAFLDIGGSFFATTAESVVFGDDIEFSAVEPQEAPLLTVNITPGLQMGANSGDITVKGNGHLNTYVTANVVPFDRNISTRGLQVSAGKTIGLVGENIFFESGVLTAEGGNIQIGAVGQNNHGLVNLNLTDSSFSIEYQDISNFGNIYLNERSLIDASGVGGASIHLQGKQIELNNASVILIQNFGTSADDGITVNATESLTLRGNSLEGLSTNEIFTEALSSGKSGDVTINTQQLRIYDGSQVGTSTFDFAAGGNVNINSTDLIEISGFAYGNLALNSAIGSASFDTAEPTGDVLVSTNKLNVLDGANILAISFGTSNTGSVVVEVEDMVNISGVIEESLFSSGIGIFAFGSGSAEDLTINASKVNVTNGGVITSSAFASGDAGNLVVNASEYIEVEGELVFDSATIRSVITAESSLITEASLQALGVFAFPNGESGNLTINTPTLRVLNGGIISVSNDGINGNAGSLDINADTIFLDNRGTLTAGANDGQGGNINVTTNNLNVSDRATISVSSLGSGQAGNLTINANSINLDNQGSLRGEVTAGNQGNINLTSQLLLLRNNSNITTNAGEEANGGNITIDTANLVALEDSDITANAIQGQGGNIFITTQGLFLSSDSQISASSEFGFDGLVTINSLNLDNKIVLIELPTNLNDSNSTIARVCRGGKNNSLEVTGRGGLPTNPYQIVESEHLLPDLGDFSEQTNISVNSPVTEPFHIPTHFPTIVEANAWIINERGNVEFVAIVPTNSQNLGQLASSCSEEENS